MTAIISMAEDFIDFVNTMPEDEEIDHSSGLNQNAWCNCAVGEFFTKFDSPLELPGDERVDELEQALKGDGLAFTFEVLNGTQPETFGELQRIIAWNLENLHYEPAGADGIWQDLI